MAKSDLLKEAIADARAVKETAVANAKIALQEAFAPRIHSMLSTKISEELRPSKYVPARCYLIPKEGVGELKVSA